MLADFRIVANSRLTQLIVASSLSVTCTSSPLFSGVRCDL